MTPERAAEYLGLLTAGVAKWEPAIGTFNALRASDIAQALALVKNTHARLLMRIKYAGEDRTDDFETQFLSALERGMLGHIVELAAPKRWKVPRENFLRDLGRLALAEHIAPKLCPKCQGRGAVMLRRQLKKVCDRCNGGGRVTISDAERARLLGVSKEAWHQSWRERYRAVAGVLDYFDDIGRRAVAFRLR
jgi:hypothetical protein